MLESKAKLAWKRYGIVALGILIVKIDMEKPEETKKKIVKQNASICGGMKIDSIFWLSPSKKDRRTSTLLVEVADAKMASMLIKERLVLSHILYGCMRYNPDCKMKQCFNCYKYSSVSVHFQKNKKCGACSDPHKTSECPWDKWQRFPLCNVAHTLWDKRYEYRKKEYLKIAAAKQNTPRLHKTSSKLTLQRRESLREIRSPSIPKPRSQSVNIAPQLRLPDLPLLQLVKEGEVQVMTGPPFKQHPKIKADLLFKQKSQFLRGQ